MEKKSSKGLEKGLQIEVLFQKGKNFVQTLENRLVEVEKPILTSKLLVFNRFRPPESLENQGV